MAEEDDQDRDKLRLHSMIKDMAETSDEVHPEFQKIDTRDRRIERDVDASGYDWDILNLNYMKESNFKEIYNFM